MSGSRIAERFAAGCGAALLFLALQGCVSYSYVDANKVQHVIGMVDIATPLSTGKTGESATSVTLTTIGLALYSRPQNNSGLTLGYNRETIVSLPNGSCVDLDTPGVCATAQAAPATPDP